MINTGKLVLILLAGVFLACNCNARRKRMNADSTDQLLSKTGPDKDEHGCLRSAGYRWSQLMKECIRPFELAPRLTNIADSTQAGYFLFSFNRKKAEFFALGFDPSLILEAKDSVHFMSPDGRYLLDETAGSWELARTEEEEKMLLFKQ